jgi:hypothetical protein
MRRGFGSRRMLADRASAPKLNLEAEKRERPVVVKVFLDEVLSECPDDVEFNEAVKRMFHLLCESDQGKKMLEGCMKAMVDRHGKLEPGMVRSIVGLIGMGVEIGFRAGLLHRGL